MQGGATTRKFSLQKGLALSLFRIMNDRWRAITSGAMSTLGTPSELFREFPKETYKQTPAQHSRSIWLLIVNSRGFFQTSDVPIATLCAVVDFPTVNKIYCRGLFKPSLYGTPVFSNSNFDTNIFYRCVGSVVMICRVYSLTASIRICLLLKQSC